MAQFKISVQDYQGSPVFDLHASGENIRAVQISTARCFGGSKVVYALETKENAELQLTIQNARGDIDVELPPGWNVETNSVASNDQDIRFPKVKVHREGKHELVGYVASQSLSVHFYKEHEHLGCFQ